MQMRQEGVSGMAILLQLKALFGVGCLKSDMKQMIVMYEH